jgi:hypothetical protein
MKRNLSFIVMVFAGTVFFTACNNDKSSTSTTPSTDTTSTVATDTSTAASTNNSQLAANETYTCTMHNEVLSDRPGKCPKCGMDLVKQKMTDEQKKLKETGNYVKPKE